jgi:hypothetical protein
MTRRTEGLGSFLAAIGVLVLIAGTVAFGWAASLTSQASQDATRQLLDRDRAAIDADMVSARAAQQNGDQPAKFLGYCQSAVTAYNADAQAAGPDLPDGYPNQLTSKECTP